MVEKMAVVYFEHVHSLDQTDNDQDRLYSIMTYSQCNEARQTWFELVMKY
jgi:hypothetical protein